MPNCGSQIVVPDRGKNVDYDRRFERGGLVFDSTAHHKAVAGANLKCLGATGDAEPAGDDVGDLIVRVAMTGTDPPFLHAVLGKKQFFIVGADGAGQTGLGRSVPYLARQRHYDIRKGLVIYFHRELS